MQFSPLFPLRELEAQRDVSPLPQTPQRVEDDPRPEHRLSGPSIQLLNPVLGLRRTDSQLNVSQRESVCKLDLDTLLPPTRKIILAILQSLECE
jgi:hypothetical protein